MGSNTLIVILAAMTAFAISVCSWVGWRAWHRRAARRRHQQALQKLQEKQAQRAATTGNYRAVAIIPARNACRQVRNHSHTRYLAREAPHLPVPGCHLPVCRCRYRHFPDRRTEDRRNPFGIDRMPIGLADDRRRRDRRRNPVAA